MENNTPQPLTATNIPELVSRYLNGESISQLATDAKRARQTLYTWMHNEASESYAPLVTQAMITRLAEADHDLANAHTMLDIARAREEAKFTRWDLERRRPALFGLKQELKTDSTITVIVQRQMQAPAEAADCLDQLQAPTDQKPSDILDLAPHVR